MSGRIVLARQAQPEPVALPANEGREPPVVLALFFEDKHAEGSFVAGGQALGEDASVVATGSKSLAEGHRQGGRHSDERQLPGCNG